MASGHVNRTNRPEHMVAPTTAARVNKTLADQEPSTHGPQRRFAVLPQSFPESEVDRTCRGYRENGAHDPSPT